MRSCWCPQARISPDLLVGAWAWQQGKCQHIPHYREFKIKILTNILELCKVNMLRLQSYMLTCCDLMATFQHPSSTLAQSKHKVAFGEKLQRKCVFVMCLQGVMLSSHKYTSLSVWQDNYFIGGFSTNYGPKFPCSTHQRNFIEFKITILPNEKKLALNHNSSVVVILQFKSFPQQGNKSFLKVYLNQYWLFQSGVLHSEL